MKPIQIISYYDELKDFNFDQSTNEMRFSMPFDWNLTKLEENKVMVHQEILLPKPSELVANSYIGTINGIDVAKDLMIDPTNSTKDVVHFMISKPYFKQILNGLTLHDFDPSVKTIQSSIGLQPNPFITAKKYQLKLTTL